MKRLLKYIGFIGGLIVFWGTIYYLYPQEPLADKPIQKLVVDKSERILKVIGDKEKVLKTYPISLGGEPKGDKQFQGDQKTPEGTYTIHAKNPNSDFHLNLGIDYPHQQDRKQARKMGKNPGGHIKIHGLKNGWGFIGKFHRFCDWTDGCIALTNKEIKELFNNVGIGTKIFIKQ